MVSWGNPEGQVTNSDLELAASVIDHTCMANCFDIHEKNPLSLTENTASLWRQRKGSATSTSPPSHLIRLQAIHQRFHHYLRHQTFVWGVDNYILDRPSQSRKQTDVALIAHMEYLNIQELPWRIWTPPSELVSVIASVL